MGDFTKGLPEIYKAGENKRLLEAIEPHKEAIEQRIAGMSYYFDPDKCPPEWLDRHLRLLGWNANLDLTERQKRRLVKAVRTIQSQGGTTRGMINALRYILGVGVSVREYLKLKYEQNGTTFPEGDINNFSFDVVFPIGSRGDDVALAKKLIDYLMAPQTFYRPIQLLQIQNNKTRSHNVTMILNKRSARNIYDPQGFDNDAIQTLKMDGSWKMDGTYYMWGSRSLPPDRKSEARHAVSITVTNGAGQIIRQGAL